MMRRVAGSKRQVVVTVSGMSAVADFSYRWFEAPVRQDLEITQVYGYLICPSTGRVLIQDDEGIFNFIGVRAGSLCL